MDRSECCRCSQRKKERSPEEYKKLEQAMIPYQEERMRTLNKAMEEIEKALKEAGTAHRDSEYFIGTLQMNSESARSMGMATNMQRRWSEHHEASLAWQALASDRASRLSTGAKFARQVLQTLALAVGAWLALDNQISAGMIVAASIIMGRALAPVEQMIGGWKQLVQARQSWKRLQARSLRL